MASSNQSQGQAQTTLEMQDLEQNNHATVENSIVNLPHTDEIEITDYSERAQWLRAAILGSNDGLLSTASLMVGIGAVREDSKTMIVAGVTGLIAGACSMAIGEFVSVYSRYDIGIAQIRRQNSRISANGMAEQSKGLPSPLQAAAASAVSFAIGAGVPLLAGGFIDEYRLRLGTVVAAVSLALIGSGILSAYLGEAPMLKSGLRVLFGGWVAMAISFGLTKLIGLSGI